MYAKTILPPHAAPNRFCAVSEKIHIIITLSAAKKAGDAAAALIGVPFGKHKIRLNGKTIPKTWEGSLAMFVVSFLCGFGILFFIQKMPLPNAIICTTLAALAGSYTELITPGKYDTVTVPIVISAILVITGFLTGSI